MVNCNLCLLLYVSTKLKNRITTSNFVVLKHETGLPLGIMDISDSKAIYKPDISKESVKVYGADVQNHPYVKILYRYL